uniref:RING-CH-type domain-containing protein n=1 Tax=Rhabditophanes sp. KR3021 TaxID=114890 RepID=A0AC35U2C6_9BILA
MMKDKENADLSDSTFDLSKAICRVCYSGEDSGAFGEGNKYGSKLISACKCSGSSGFYHTYCIEKWIKSAEGEGNRICEICLSPYNFKVVSPSRYAFLIDKNTNIGFISIILATVILILSNVIVITLCFFYTPFNYGSSICQYEQTFFKIGQCTLTALLALIFFVSSVPMYWILTIFRMEQGHSEYAKLNEKYIFANYNDEHAILNGNGSGKRKRKLNDVDETTDDMCIQMV